MDLLKANAFQVREAATYKVRDLIQIPLTEFLDLNDVKLVYLEFDDGTIESTSRELIYCRHLWELYQYLPIPAVLKHHHLRRSKEHVIQPMTDSEILNDILWDSKKLSDENNIELDMDNVLYQQYCIIDKIDAFVRTRLGSYVVSVNIRDFHEIMKHPDIVTAQEQLDNTEYATSNDISAVYRTISNTIRKDKGLKYNIIVLAYITTSIKSGQLYKIVGPNGLVTEVDSSIFHKRPIKSSFARGLNELVDIAIESRTSAMSIYYQEDAMKESEYLTRRVQSEVSSLWHVVKNTDCGTRDYVPFFVPEKANLSDLEGKWFYDSEQEKEVLITSDNANRLGIRGTVIKLRSIIGCKYPSRVAVCAKCYGEIADSIMEGDNIGQIAATAVQEKQSQRILSNKHMVMSASVDGFTFTEGEMEYLTTVPRNNDFEIIISPKLKGCDVWLTFDYKDAKRIQDIVFVEDLSTISPVRLSSLKMVKVTVKDRKGDYRENVIRTATQTRSAFLTTEALKYIKQHGWKIDKDNRYVVHLKDWDFEESVMGLPKVQFSTPKHMAAVRDFITNTAKRKANGEIIHEGYQQFLARAPSPAAGLGAFYELVQSSLRVNIIHLEAFVLSMMVESIDDDDYRIPLDKSKGQIASFSNIMYKRDLALAISYEAHFMSLFQVMDSYTIKHRHPHPFNKLLAG